MTTKDQERKALAQIRKIVAGLGEDSYIGTAFEGCFEIAESNIENDFADSMKCKRDIEARNAEKAREELSTARKACQTYKDELELAKATMKQEAERADRWAEKYKEMASANTQNWNSYREQEEKAEQLQQEIIRLKARLFDMMEAQGA